MKTKNQILAAYDAARTIREILQSISLTEPDVAEVDRLVAEVDSLVGNVRALRKELGLQKRGPKKNVGRKKSKLQVLARS